MCFPPCHSSICIYRFSTALCVPLFTCTKHTKTKWNETEKKPKRFFHIELVLRLTLCLVFFASFCKFKCLFSRRSFFSSLAWCIDHNFTPIYSSVLFCTVPVSRPPLSRWWCECVCALRCIRVHVRDVYLYFLLFYFAAPSFFLSPLLCSALQELVKLQILSLRPFWGMHCKVKSILHLTRHRSCASFSLSVVRSHTIFQCLYTFLYIFSFAVCQSQWYCCCRRCCCCYFKFHAIIITAVHTYNLIQAVYQ